MNTGTLGSPLKLGISLMPLLLLGCGGGSGNGSSNDSLGLSGTWQGVLEDIQLNMYNTKVEIDDRQITRIVLDGFDGGDKGEIREIASSIYEFELDDGTYGGFLTSPSKNHVAYTNELADFGVLQKGASSAGVAQPTDINGTWSGTYVGFFAGELYQYTATDVCSYPTCVFTVTGPLRDATGNTIDDSMVGSSTTYTVGFREGVVFDTEFEVSPGVGGYGAMFLSADKSFAGVYGCLDEDAWQDCEFGAITKQ